MPVSPPLTTTESGTATSVRPTNTLEFNGADFTVTGSGDKATISIDSTGTGAALTDTYIGFGNASNLLTGSASLTFDDTNKKLLVIGDSDNDTVFEIQGGDTAAGAGPRLTITNTAGTDSDIQLTCDNYAVGILSGGLGATQREVMRFGQMSSDSFTTVFNEGGLPADFRIEGDTEANLFYLDGGQDNVGIGGVPDSGVERLHVLGTGTGTLVKLESTDASASAAPELRLFRNSASPAPNDALGRIVFSGEDDASAEQSYFEITVKAKDETAATIDSVMLFEGPSNSSTVEYMRMSRSDGGVIVNEQSSSLIDFRVESNNLTHALFVDASQDNVGIGAAPDSGVERLHVQTTNLATVLQRWETTAAPTTADFAVKLEVKADGTPVANASGLGCIDFIGKDSGGADTTYARMAVVMADKGAGSEDGILKFDLIDGSSVNVEHLQMGNGNVVINEDQVNVNFRVEGDSDDSLIRTVASDDSVGIGTLPDTNTAKLQVTDDGTKSYTILLESTDGDANAGPTFGMWRNSPSPAAGDDIGTIYFAGEDDGGGRTNYCQIDGEADGIVATNESATINFRVLKSGNLRKAFRVRYSEVVVNEDSDDINFRVESNANSTMFQVDAGLDRVSVGASSTSGGATFQVPDNTISSYCNVKAVRSDGVATQTFLNEDCQGQTWVNDSVTAWTLDLPESTVKGMHFYFVSTNGDMTVDPNPSGGTSITLNGGTGALSRATNYEVYHVICYDTNKWLLTNPA